MGATGQARGHKVVYRRTLRSQHQENHTILSPQPGLECIAYYIPRGIGLRFRGSAKSLRTTIGQGKSQRLQVFHQIGFPISAQGCDKGATLGYRPYYSPIMKYPHASNNGASTVLVVEDNPDDTFLLQLAARESCPEIGFQFVTDGHKALSYLNGDGHFADRQTYPFPKVVLLDVRLPAGMDGFQLLERIRRLSHCDGLTVLAWSDGSDPHLGARLKEAGVDHFIPKPSSFRHLLEEVGRICALAHANGARTSPCRLSFQLSAVQLCLTYSSAPPRPRPFPASSRHGFPLPAPSSAGSAAAARPEPSKPIICKRTHARYQQPA
jgi:CheY-like chemotaxis protein